MVVMNRRVEVEGVQSELTGSEQRNRPVTPAGRGVITFYRSSKKQLQDRVSHSDFQSDADWSCGGLSVE